MEAKRYHIICDLKNCNKKISSPNSLREFIDGLVKLVKMSILEGPIVAEGKPENPGFSAVVIIDFSHISIHTFTKYNEALIDIFSCKPFERNIVMDYCLAFFGAKHEESRVKEVWWG